MSEKNAPLIETEAIASSEETELSSSKKAFIEPEISVPVDVLEATTFLQAVDSGALGSFQMQVVASRDRPALAETYEIAGRLLLLDTPSVTISAATDRIMSMLRLSRKGADTTVLPDAVLTLTSAKFDLPSTVEISAVTEEAVYYQDGESYFVRLGDSVISADVSAIVKASLAEDLDCQSLLFGRVLSHGLATALRRAGAFELHCAAVIEPETKTTVLIVGPSGSGKSTLALHLAACGWSFSTDDVVLLTAANESVAAHGLREFFAITTDTILHSGLSELGPLMDGQATDSALKIRLHPQDIFSSKMIDKCVPDLLVFLSRPANPAVGVQPLKQSDVMKRLLRMCPGAAVDRPVAAQFLRVLELLTRQCKAFDLLAGTDLLGDPEYTSAFLASVVDQEQAA